MTTSNQDVTALLLEWGDGDPKALDALMPRVYGELHKLARHHFDKESDGHTLQTTALVNEVYLRLVNWRKVSWENRVQFFGFTGKLMRRILIDSARLRKAAKRGAGAPRIELDAAEALPANRPGGLDLDTLLALDSALERLAGLDPRQAETVELRFFAGLSIDETAEVLGTSPATVKRDWITAKLWLARELADTPANGASAP